MKTRTLSENVKIDPQEYVYLAPPTKNSKNIDRSLFWSEKIKTWTLLENVKIDPEEYVYLESPSTI